MFGNKQFAQISRKDRLQSTISPTPRAKTPSSSNRNKNSNHHFSQSKNILPLAPPISKNNLLTPINEQVCFDRPYYLGKGNNHELIRRILNRRKGWGQSTNQQFVYLKWLQNSQSFKFHLLGKQVYCFNHFEYHRELSNKQRLVQNLVNFCQSNKMNAYSFIPVTYIIDLNTGEEDISLHSFIKFYNRNHPDAEDSSNRRYQSIILPRVKYTPYYTAQQLNKRSQGNFYCKPYCPKSFIDPETNPFIWILKPTFLNRGRGVALFRSLDELEKLIWKYFEGDGLEEYGDKFPLQYDGIVEKKTIRIDEEEKKEKKELSPQNSLKKQEKKEQLSKSVQRQMSRSEPYIPIQTKPLFKEEKLNNNKRNAQDKSPKIIRDQGLSDIQKKNKQVLINKSPQQQSSNTEMASSTSIPVTNKEEDVNTSSPSKISGTTNPRCLKFVIQKYIEQPMLIENKKFDIRVWVLLTHTQQVYFFEEGYLRFSSHQYSTKDNHNNPFIHLTNNSVQKYCSQYDKVSGNQISLSELQQYIKPEQKAATIFKSIKSKIKDIVWLSICSVRRKINVNSRKICFELLGYDFMIDRDYKVWLIEVNTNPALDQSGPLLKMILPRMIDDMFKLTIDKIFNNQIKQDAEVLKVDGEEDEKNMWQMLGDLKEGNNDRSGRRLTFVRR